MYEKALVLASFLLLWLSRSALCPSPEEPWGSHPLDLQASFLGRPFWLTSGPHLQSLADGRRPGPCAFPTDGKYRSGLRNPQTLSARAGTPYCDVVILC
jgi:hypothetical protein